MSKDLAETIAADIRLSLRDSLSKAQRQAVGFGTLTCHAAALAALSAIEREGFKVVPVEPTEEMLEGGREWALGGSTFAAKRCWPAMLAAAPKQG